MKTNKETISSVIYGYPRHLMNVDSVEISEPTVNLGYNDFSVKVNGETIEELKFSNYIGFGFGSQPKFFECSAQLFDKLEKAGIQIQLDW